MSDSKSQNIVLEEDYDENYEPTNEEIIEYATFIGMNPDEDPIDIELLWIAREGLKAPLPSDWKPCQTDEGDVYYFNFKTGESLWDHPCDEFYKQKFLEEKMKLIQSKESEQNPGLTIPTVVLQSDDSDVKDADKILRTSNRSLGTSSSSDNVSKRQEQTQNLKSKKNELSVSSASMPHQSSHNTLSVSHQSLKAPGQNGVKLNLAPSVNLLHVGSSRSLNSKSNESLVSSILNLAAEARRATSTSNLNTMSNISEEEKQKEYLQKKLSNRVEQLRKQLEEREMEEQRLCEEELTLFKQRLDNEKTRVEREEKRKHEQVLSDIKRKLEAEYNNKRKQEEFKIQQEYQDAIDLIKDEYQLKQEQEKQRLHQLYKDANSQLEKELKAGQSSNGKTSDSDKELKQELQVLKQKLESKNTEIKSLQTKVQDLSSNPKRNSDQDKLELLSKDYQDEYIRIEQEWTQKLLSLKKQLQFEQNLVEDKLQIIKQENQKDPDLKIVSEIKNTKALLERVLEYNQQEFDRQNKKKNELDKISKDLEQYELSIRERKQKVKAHKKKKLSSSSSSSSGSESGHEINDEKSLLNEHINQRLQLEQDRMKSLQYHLKDQKKFIKDKYKHIGSRPQTSHSYRHDGKNELDDTLRISEIDNYQHMERQSNNIENIIMELRKSHISQQYTLPDLNHSRFRYTSTGPVNSKSYYFQQGHVPVELRQWENDRLKTEELLRSHQQWLTQFRHKIGLQKLPITQNRFQNAQKFTI